MYCCKHESEYSKIPCFVEKNPKATMKIYGIYPRKKTQFESVNMYYLHWILLDEDIYVQNYSTLDWCYKLGFKVNKFFVIIVISFVLFIKGNSKKLSHFISSPMHMMSLLGQYLVVFAIVWMKSINIHIAHLCDTCMSS